ncbi:MAG: hypothetical protein IPG10_06300 [Flavobacteriales bacterium]|nr:hypothetical protein [Flavobacteriales bacterium]
MSPLRALRSSLVLCAALCVIAAAAQSEKGTVMAKYRRSSLHMVLVEAGDFPNKDVVIKAYHDQPFPDKYNDHKVAANTLDASRYPITETDRILAGYKSEGESSKETQNALASATGGLTAGMMDSTAKDTRLRIDRFIKETKLANQLVAKWFNRKEDGTMDGDLVVERGAYGATQLEYMVAQGAANKQAFKDAVGDEMIPNTFVVFSKLNFVENEPVARAILDGTRSSLTDTTEFLGKLALASAQAVYNSTKDGYSVWTTSWLYQLVWNDSIQYRFWKELWIDDRNVDSLKKAAFDTTDLFQLSYVGSEKSRSLVAANLEQGGVAEEVIHKATVRNLDATIAKLQKKFDVFKPRVPVLTTAPITAFIGMKEGLDGGEKFDAMELTEDPKTGVRKYKSIATVTVEKGKVWDNRYVPGEERAPVLQNDSIAPSTTLDRTYFKGSDKVQPGMLLKQIR